MEFEYITKELMLIYGGVAVAATLFLFLKQTIILSYMALGMLIGPYGLKLLNRADHIEHISHLGIMLLLFLIGLNLHPHKLLSLFKKSSIITTATCAIFAATVGLIAFAVRYPVTDSLVIGLALMFSSTVVGLKLIPTTTLHQKHTGEVMISILLFQDILAIIIIIFLGGMSKVNLASYISLLILKGIFLVAFAILFVKYVILWLFRKFDVIQEYIFVVALGWCLSIAGIAKIAGLSYEIGAFIAGFTLAISPVSLVLSESLKPLREFFLILFFFAMGAQFDFLLLKPVLWQSMVISVVIIVVKPLVFSRAFKRFGESVSISRELAFRLGQASEFSLLVAYTAIMNNRISDRASYLIQFTVIVTFIISTYLVTRLYPTPISTNREKRRD